MPADPATPSSRFAPRALRWFRPVLEALEDRLAPSVAPLGPPFPVNTFTAGDQSARGRAVGFTMALLQRRMASSVYAVRRSLERMRERREKILADPEAYRREQIERRIPEDFDELTEDAQQRITAQLEAEVLSADPAVLREEIGRLTRLIDQAQGLEGRDAQSKLNRLRAVLTDAGWEVRSVTRNLGQRDETWLDVMAVRAPESP